MTKIVVSGIGLVTPLGSSREESWSRLIHGESAIVSTADGIKAPVTKFSANGARSRTGDFALLAAKEALFHADLNRTELARRVVGCAVSQSKPLLMADDKDSLDPDLVLSSFFGWSSEALIKREFNLNGPTTNIAAACATGVASIELGSHWIASGQCDIALVGASESSFHELYRAGFDQMGVLVQGNDPKLVCPFDRRRSGFAMGEGAAVLVLEDEVSAENRGHKPLCSVLRVKMRHSSHDPIRFDPDGNAIAQLIRDVIPECFYRGSDGFPSRSIDNNDVGAVPASFNDNGTAPLTTCGNDDKERGDDSILGYINAHGTGTRFNDAVETRGIHAAFGERARHIPVSSTKAATGHLLGAAGAVEAAFCALALRDQIIPPTLNFEEPDPDCDLDYVPHHSRKTALKSALSLSYGFGGQMGAVLFGK